MSRDQVVLELDGRDVPFSNPDKVFFPMRGHTKLDLCDYYLAVAEPFLRHMRDRPTSMKRFPNGADDEFFFQKRVPKGAPDWVAQMTVSFPFTEVRRAALALAREVERRMPGKATWPPHFAKQRGEPKRVQPSRARRGA